MGVKCTCLKVEIKHKEIEGPPRGKESFRVFSCDSMTTKEWEAEGKPY